MFGKLIGKVLSAPIRVANLPLRALDHLTDPSPKQNEPTALSTTLEHAARGVERAAGYVCGDDSDE